MRNKKPIVLTIGVFDGVHQGHQALLRRASHLAKRLKASPEAVTFQDHPMHILRGGPRIPFLLPRHETFERLQEKGASKVHILRFTKAFSRKSPEKFVQWLQGLGALKGIVVGENFRFGQGAKGDVDLLKSLGKRSGFQVVAVKPVKIGGKVVSSSQIRLLLAEGKTDQANRMLGHPYAIEGKVVHGRHVGHKIGFPTANLKGIANFLPKDGVYACVVKLGEAVLSGGDELG